VLGEGGFAVGMDHVVSRLGRGGLTPDPTLRE